MHFALGQTVITPGAMAALTNTDVLNALARHAAGDWGDVCGEDGLTNDEALRSGARLLSAYRTCNGVKFWIITEADRSVTTILLPEEY
jgi:hypothetical protein